MEKAGETRPFRFPLLRRYAARASAGRVRMSGLAAMQNAALAAGLDAIQNAASSFGAAAMQKALADWGLAAMQKALAA